MSKHHNPRRKSERSNFIPATDLKRMARGRWREILVAAGMPAVSLDGRKGRPCPRCGGRDRFAPMLDLAERGAVLCRHCHHGSTEPRSGGGISTLRWWLGIDTGAALQWLASFLGVGRGNHAPRMHRPIERAVAIPKQVVTPERWERLAEAMRRNMRPDVLEHCAALLGLPSDPLVRLGVGWSPNHQGTSWPMRDYDDRIVGIRLRCPTTARKWAIPRSRAGLIYDPKSTIEPIDRLWIVEGGSDTAALMSIGLRAVGVPSAGGSAELLLALSRRIRPSEVVVVADRDEAGQRGAERLRDALLIVSPVRIVSPPVGIKDARAWVVGGADREILERAADVVDVFRLTMGGVNHG